MLKAGLLRVFLMLNIMGCVFIRPLLLQHAAVIDLINAVLLVFLIPLCWMDFTHLPAHYKSFAYATLAWILIGGIASITSLFPLQAFGYVLKEIYLLVLSTLFVVGLRELKGYTLFVEVWLYTSLFEALATIAYYLTLHPARSIGTFADPNMAADYLAISIIFAAGAPIDRVSKTLMLGVLIIALLLAGSIGALAALILVFIATSMLFLIRKPTKRHAARLLFMASLLCIVFWGYLAMPSGAYKELECLSPVIKPLEHIDISTNGHMSAIISAFRVWSLHPLTLGVGPGMLTFYKRELGLPNQSEAHNDFLASLVEKGMLGLLALLLMWWLLIKQSIILLMRGGFGRILAAALCLVALQTLQIELIHWRHIWLLIAAIFAYPISESSTIAFRAMNTSLPNSIKSTFRAQQRTELSVHNDDKCPPSS